MRQTHLFLAFSPHLDYAVALLNADELDEHGMPIPTPSDVCLKMPTT